MPHITGNLIHQKTGAAKVFSSLQLGGFMKKYTPACIINQVLFFNLFQSVQQAGRAQSFVNEFFSGENCTKVHKK